MEEVRYQASFGAGPSNKDKFKELAEKQQSLRHIKEKSEAAQELVQKIESGLSHIADLLGVEKREEDQTSSVGDLLRDIETALDTVIDEREKQQQQLAGQQQSQTQAGNAPPALLAIPGTESLRSPFSRMQTPDHKANIPALEMGYDVTKSFAKPRNARKKSKTAEAVLLTKARGLATSTPRDSDDEEQVELADRAHIKAASLKSLRDAERRAAIQAKKYADAQASMMK
jgi:hypothetical protein